MSSGQTKALGVALKIIANRACAEFTWEVLDGSTNSVLMISGHVVGNIKYFAGVMYGVEEVVPPGSNIVRQALYQRKGEI